MPIFRFAQSWVFATAPLASAATLRLVLDWGGRGSENLQLSAFSVSDLALGSGVSREPPADEGKMPSDRGLSLLVERLKKR